VNGHPPAPQLEAVRTPLISMDPVMRIDDQSPAEQALVPARDRILAWIGDLLEQRQTPIVIALDGGSGSGKSTLAAMIADEIGVAVIPLDDFFAGRIPAPAWSLFSAEEKLCKVFEWARVCGDALLPLKKGEPARWFAFDFDSGLRSDGTYGLEHEPKVLMPAKIILLEGAYSSGPELSDLVDYCVLLDVSIEERHARLADRQDEEFSSDWHQLWDEVEELYFSQSRPRDSFDLVLDG